MELRKPSYVKQTPQRSKAETDSRSSEVFHDLNPVMTKCLS